MGSKTEMSSWPRDTNTKGREGAQAPPVKPSALNVDFRNKTEGCVCPCNFCIISPEKDVSFKNFS